MLHEEQGVLYMRIENDEELKKLVEDVVTDVFITDTFAELLRGRFRKGDGRLKDDCSFACGVDVRTLYRYLDGSRKPPLSVIIYISLFLKLPYHDFRRLLSSRGFFEATSYISDRIYTCILGYPAEEGFDYLKKVFGRFIL